MEFSQYKSNAMKKLDDALSEGLVDEGAISVINSFNSHPDIFTTSSCAGRIQLIILPDIGRKDSVQRRKTWHREVTAEEVKEAISEFDIPDNSIVRGIPGKAIGRILDKHTELIKRAGGFYVERSKIYKEAGL